VFYRDPQNRIRLKACKIDIIDFHLIQIYKMEQPVIQEYLRTLTPKQMKAYEIARDHLKDSFQIEKSNGFLEWYKKVYSTAKKETPSSE